jgi:hypothetical protein
MHIHNKFVFTNFMVLINELVYVFYYLIVKSMFMCFII